MAAIYLTEGDVRELLDVETAIEAVEEAFEVRVASVNTMNRKGKRKRNRRGGGFGHRSDTKRAIVRLQGDDRIELFES